MLYAWEVYSSRISLNGGKKMKYKKILLLSICLLLGSLVLTTVPMVSAVDIQTGYEPYATLKAGVRYKDFGNGGDRAVYLGVPDLGVSTNRVESEYTWSSSHYVIFDYKMRDPSTNIYTGIDANDPLLSYDVGTLTSIDYIQIDVVSRNSGTVSFQDVSLSYSGGFEPLGTFTSNTEGWKTWMITGIDISDWFVIEGNIVLTGTQPLGEHSKVQISVGTMPVCGDDVWVDDDADPSWYDYYHVDNVQEGIDHACEGGTVHVAEGIYTENIIVDKYVKILGSGSDTSGSIITQDAAGAGDSRVGVVQIEASGLSTSEPLLFQDLRIEPVGIAGFSVGRFTEATGKDIDFVKLDNVHVIGTNTNPSTEQERGFYVDLTSRLSSLTVIDSAFNDLTYGWYFQKQVSAETSTVEQVTVTGTEFSHNNHKGVYAEKLSEATFTDCTVENNGYDSSILPSYFAPWSAGIDLNLKAGYYNTFLFDSCTFIANAIDESKEGVALTVKGRGTGSDSSYSSNPAFVDDITVVHCTFDGNERGIRFGEPGKNNLGPTNVIVEENNIVNNIQHYSGIDGTAYGGLINVMDPTVSVMAECNWWGDISGPSGIGTGTGDAAVGTIEYLPWLDGSYPGGNCVGGIVAYNHDNLFYYPSIQTAIDDATPGDRIEVIVPVHSEGPQIHVNKDITIFGSGCGSTVIHPTSDTGTSGDSRAWWLIDDGIEFHLADMTLDGSGYRIYQALRHKGHGMIDGVCFTEIKYDESGPYYNGVAVAAFGSSGPVHVTDCSFTEIGRVGLLYFGTGVSGSTFNQNTYTGKGDGNWLDYCLDISAGATVTVTNNLITDCTGVASSDGSTSAAIMVTTLYGAGTAATIEYNDILDSTTGIAVGYDDTDTSSVVAHCNRIVGNDYGVDTTSQLVDATCNYWGDCSGPSGEGPGMGDSVSTNVLFDPWVGKITVDAGGPYSIPEDSLTVHFNGAYTTAGCCDEIVTIEWDFGDGHTSNQIDPHHTYASNGHYVVTLTITTITLGEFCSDSDSTTVNLGGADPPIIQLITPEDGETIDGTYTVYWYAIDNDYPGGFGIPIYLYYKPLNSGSWRQLNSMLTNNIDAEHGSYEWDTSGIADGEYLLLAEALDSHGNMAHDTVQVRIGNGNAGVMVSDIQINDETFDTTEYVKNGDTVVITAGITGRESIDITAENILADLSGFGIENTISADSFDGFTATWTLDNVVCNPPDGLLTVQVSVGESTRTATITADNTAPEANLIKPLNGIYLFGTRIAPFGKTVIIGSLDVIIEANEDIAKTEFFVDGVLLETDTNDLSWTMNIKSMGNHELNVIIYDGAGNTETSMVEFTMYNPFGVNW